MKLLSGEERSIFDIAMNREASIAAKLDEKAGGYYTRICNAIEQKVDSAIPRAAVVELIGKLKEASRGSRTIDALEVITMLEDL